MHESPRVWFCFAHFQLQPVPKRLERLGRYQLEQDVWSELSSADIWVCLFVLSSVFGSEPEQLTMSRWGVQQTWCRNSVTERYFKLTLNVWKNVVRVVGLTECPALYTCTLPMTNKETKPTGSCTSFCPWLQDSSWSDLASLPSGAPQHYICLSV